MNPNRAIRNHATDSSSQPSSIIQKPVKSIMAEEVARPKCRSNLAAKSLRSTYASSERPKRFEPGRTSKQSTLTDVKLRPIPGDPPLKPLEPLQRIQGRYIRQAHKDHMEPCFQVKLPRPTVKSKSTVEVSSIHKHAAKVKQLSSIPALTAAQDESQAQTLPTKVIARTQTPFVRRSRTLGKLAEISDESTNSCGKCLEYRQNIAVLTLAIRKLQRQGQKMVAMLKNKENIINQLKTELSQIMLQSQPIGTTTKCSTSTAQTTDTDIATLPETPLGPNPSLQEVTGHVESDVLKVQLHQARIDLQELQNFLANLLYTLNTRGYESITDQFGNSIDLSRCKGNQLLELKGQDGRRMLAMNRTSVHENALKAFIGSQEQLIQQLMCQLNDMQRYCQVHEKPANSETRSIDADIFNLTTLLEATCNNVPDQILGGLLEEHQESSKGVDQDQGDVVDSAVLDDCKVDSDKIDTGCS